MSQPVTGRIFPLFRKALFAAVMAFIAAGPFICDRAAAKENPRYAAIVMDADTGMILSQSSADKSLHPASLAKIMTLVLAFEAIEQGQLRLRDRIPISSHAASMVPSKLNLPVGSTIRVEDAIYAIITKSANDIAVALAEKIGGTESRFATMMNNKAREIGMTKTYYRNASGLHNKAQVTSARDQAKLARHVIRNYPQYYHYFSTRQFTYNGVTYRNHNRLMETYRGMDGFKTGFIGPSGFNLVASAVRNNRRLIGVVFGGNTASSRNAQMAKLLDSAFGRMDSVMVAQNVPLPSRKPQNPAVQLAGLSPSGGPAAAEAGAEVKWAMLNPMMQSKAFSALVGQGDYDPAATKRLETGLMAIAAIKGESAGGGIAVPSPAMTGARYSGAGSAPQVIAAAPAALPSGAPVKSWSVQIGAFASRVKTDTAIREALARLPGALSGAVPVIVPLRTAEGWLFRGRISGFSHEEAMRACRYIPECLTVSPQAY